MNMGYVPITPFGRPVDSGLLAHVVRAETDDLPPAGIDKWEVLRELGVAARKLGVGDRELTVLQALLSFHPGQTLGPEGELVVFPSNASICARLNGMPCSTMRRHLAGLVRAGLILRRDSPNGKRYARRSSGEAFGFDLTPLLTRFAEIAALAEETRAEADAYRRLRQDVSLMRRDLANLAAYGASAQPGAPFWSEAAALATETAAALRRKLDMADLDALAADMARALDTARDLLSDETEELGTNGTRIEQHIQNSNTELTDLEPCLEKAEGDGAPLPNVPLGLVLAVCAEFRTLAPEEVRHWHQFVRAVETLRPMMGISRSAWAEAVTAMGPKVAAVVVAAILERMGEINSPGGYLRHLTGRAREGAFSCGPMVMALLRRQKEAA